MSLCNGSPRPSIILGHSAAFSQSRVAFPSRAPSTILLDHSSAASPSLAPSTILLDHSSAASPSPASSSSTVLLDQSSASSSSLVFPLPSSGRLCSHRPNNTFPLRRLCLFLCSVFGIFQIVLLHRRLLPIDVSFHYNQKVPNIGLTAQLLQRRNGRNESNEWTPDEDERFVAAAEQRLPDCLIIGARKGGTRALLDALALHPRIRVARHEVHFFDRTELFRLGSEWYRKQMPEATANEVVLEKTPAYFTNQAVPKRVYALNSSMKMILIVREPVARTISDFTQIRQTKIERNKESIEFQKKSFVYSSNGSLELNTQFRPIRNSLYSEHFGRWMEHFSKEQFLVLDGDKFIRDPLSQIRLVEHFFHIGPGVRPDQLVYNIGKGFYCFRRDRTVPIHCLGPNKGRVQMPVTKQFRRQMTTLIRPYNRRFFSQLNVELPGWDL